MKNYDHKEIEKKWQQRWAEEELYKTPNEVKGKENFYTLVEFLYPSGDVHMGHWYAFCVPDIFSRLKRMQGFNVLFPMGFDAFGLPAENAAIKHGANPSEWTQNNIEKARKQLSAIGATFDWDREVVTCEPEYYRWTQWLFLRLYKEGLAYRGRALVNWCPKDQTVLANEQVINGACERCDTEVEQKELEQWFLKTTAYADRLIDDLKDLDWPEPIKDAQRNWIGKSEGAEIDFYISNSDKKIKVFTTRPDTLFGATYMVLAPEHELIQELIQDIENKEEVEKYIKDSVGKSDLERQENKEKTGVELKGIKAINPGNSEEIPILIADYVLNTYGTGAIMAVPAHDGRDFEFANKFNLEIKQVMVPCYVDSDNPPKSTLEDVTRNIAVIFVKNKETNEYALLKWHGKQKGIITGIMGGIEDGETVEDGARKEILEEAGLDNTNLVKEMRWVTDAKYCAAHKNENRHAKVHALLFEVDNLNKQRTIAKEEKEKHSLMWVHEDKVRESITVNHQKILWDHIRGDQPLIVDGNLINSGEFDGLESEEAKEKITKYVGGEMTTTYKIRDWLISRQRYWGTPIPIVYDPEGNAHSVPDEHLPWELPKDVDFIPTGEAPLAKSKELLERTEKIFGKGWKPEVDTMDVFMDSSWYFMRYIDSKNKEEFSSMDAQKKWLPVNRYSGGAEHTTVHILYSRFFYKALYDIGLVTKNEPYEVRMNRGIILAEDGRKMSKRWGNVINPDDLVERVGADSVRTYFAFIGPYNEVGSFPWSTNGLIGVRRFLERVMSLSEKISDEKTLPDLDVLLNKTIKKVGEDIESMKFNTSVSSLMILSNELLKLETVPRGVFEAFLKLLAPFAPHLTEEMWENLGNKTSIHLENWPEYDENKIVRDMVNIAIQIGGKTRGAVEVPNGATEELIIEKAKEDQKLAKHLDFEPKKVIFVPGKVLNLIP